MNAPGILTLSTALALFATWLFLTTVRTTRSSVAPAVRSLRGGARPRTSDTSNDADDRLAQLGRYLGAASTVPWPSGTLLTLRLIERTPSRHLGLLASSSMLGLVVPPLVVAGAARSPIAPADAGTTTVIPASVALAGAVLAPILVHASASERARQTRLTLRHQLSAFVDVVTMLLAGNDGHEGALRHAAQAGDGRLFRELRRRMREVAATGRSLVDALDLVATDLDMAELGQIASTSRLAAAEGAPVARSLRAKCASLRSTLAADHEAVARVRTDKVTPPMVGMTLLFMAVLIFPALDL